VSEPYLQPKELEAVTSVFEKFCLMKELQILAKAADKHGSWEWAAVNQDDINRYVSVALTEAAEALGGPRFYSVEVWAEAEARANRGLFQRTLVSAFRTNERVMPEPIFVERLSLGLNQAWERTMHLREQDLGPRLSIF
jgi:hypothetical protein